MNLSARQLQHADLLGQIDSVLADTGLHPHDLVLELTESTLQHDEHALRIAQLRERGLRLSMELYFGTGISSARSTRSCACSSIR